MTILPLSFDLGGCREDKDHNLWDVIVNRDLEEEPAPSGDQSGPSAPPAPKTTKQLAARRNQERVKSILLLAIPDEYLHKSSFRSLPSSWNQIALIMRNKPDIDEIDIDDLYNNLRVYEDELKRSLCSNSASQNFAFLSSENNGGTNEVSTVSGDFRMDGDDLEELDLQWQVDMLTVRKSSRRSYGDNGRSNAPTNESSSQALVAQDGLGGYDWSNDFEVEPVNYALMAISSSSSSSSSDSEDEKYEFQNYELKCREIKINNLNLELEKVVKERDELKDKIAKWEESTKNLDEILNSQMSARDKTGLGYSTQLNELSSNHETDSENSLSIFDVRSSDEENTPKNDRFLKNGYKAVPPPITGNFLTPRADISFAGLDEYAIRNKIIESQTTKLNTKTSETAGQTNAEKPKSASESVVSNPKIDRDRVIIEDWNSDDEEEEYEVQTVRLESQTVKPRVVKVVKILRNKELVLGKPSVSTARPVCIARLSVSTARFVCTARLVCTARPVYATRPIYLRMDNVRPRGSCSPIKRSYYTKLAFRPKDLKQDVKTFGVQNMTTVGIRAVVNTGKGKLDTNLKKSRVVGGLRKLLDHGNPEILLQDHAVVDSGCSSHMTGNKAYLFYKLKILMRLCGLLCDNGTEFKNHAMNEFCAKKGIKREFNLLLPIPFWAEAVNTACYVLNRVLVTKPQNKTPYELLIGKSPSISFMRPFGCSLTILNTLDSLGKFDGKSDEGYLLGYSTSSKAFRVYNKRTKRVEENLHINFLKDQPNVAGTAPNWMFDLDFLTSSMNYIPVSIENQVIVDAGAQDSYVAVKDVVQDAQEQPSENASPDKGIQVLKDVFDKEGQHQMPEDEQVWQDELEMMIPQEVVANAMNDESRQIEMCTCMFKDQDEVVVAQEEVQEKVDLIENEEEELIEEEE
ncbi:retrovirus-related pol polyprotein from transposon TNT 1-94 [Tanacetum coccineum]